MPDVSNVAILAPAGYGKTTLMAQLEANEERSTAWLTLDESDSDPATLLLDIAGSFAAAGLHTSPDQNAPRRRSKNVITRGLNELWGVLDDSVPTVLFLDQVDHISSQSGRDLIGAVMTMHPENLQVVVASRSDHGLPLPLLRSRGAVTELTVPDLVMSQSEVRDMFEILGVGLPPSLDAIRARTEGWPVAIYLTALAVRSGTIGPGVAELRGDDILFADYLEQELLRRVPDEIRSFLVRTSILERLSGPLCDHVLATAGSGEVLTQLETQSLLVVPLDRTRTWYRYHSLLRDLLRSQLERGPSGEASALHTRAAEWFMENDHADLAAEHAIAAGDTKRFADIALSSARRMYSEGRVETISRWWEWMEKSGHIAELGELAAVAAFFRGLDGDAAGAELMAVHALSDESGRPKPTEQLGPLALMLRSYRAAGGVEQVSADARAATALLGYNSDWFHICLGQEASALIALDGVAAADSTWAEALLRSQAVDAHPAASYAAGHRAVASIDRGDWEAAESFADLSLTIIEKGGLEDYITSALGFSVAARVAARKGDIDTAHGHLARASAIRPRLSVGIPLGSVLTLHEMARAFIELADVAGARRVMREAADILASRPRLGTILSVHENIKATLSSLPAGTVGPSSLTKAELRILPQLVTHLTYPEIADRLFVSRHTVKAHAMSIYRKLGVSSRSDAVDKAREIGLISP